MPYTRPGASIPRFYSAPLRKNQRCHWECDTGCADHSKSTSHMPSAGAFRQANFCWKQKAMPSAGRFNRYVQPETRDTTYCPTSSKAVCVLEIVFNTVIHQVISYSATAPAKGNLHFTHSFKILNTNIEPFNHGLALLGGVGVGVHMTAIAAGTQGCAKWPNSSKNITQPLPQSVTHHLITMQQIQLRGSILPALGKDCKWNDSYIYLYTA